MLTSRFENLVHEDGTLLPVDDTVFVEKGSDTLLSESTSVAAVLTELDRVPEALL